MNDQRPIPIPWRVRWLRFRHQLLPVITLLVCSVLTGWLWYHQTAGGHAVGAVEVLHLPVTSGVQGTLAYLTSVPGTNAKGEIKVFDKVGEGDVVAVFDAAPFKTRREAVQAELNELNKQLRSVTSSTDTNGSNNDAAVREKALRAQVKAKEQDLADLDQKIDSLQLRSPLSGTVTHVHRRPGQVVAPGDIIMEISADRSTAIVAYLRADQQQINPAKGMPVQVYLNRRPAQTVMGQVDSVGGQIEPIPNRQLRDQKIPEWGLPVRVAVPDGFELRPGEVVTLNFKPATATR